MKSYLLLLNFACINIVFAQIMKPLENNEIHDVVFEADFVNNKFYYYNSRHRINSSTSNISNKLKVSGNIKLYDFTTNETSNNFIYSKTDSINEILAIITDNIGDLYTIRALKKSINDSVPTWYLEKRNENLSKVEESNLLPFNDDIHNIVNAFFDENNNLYIKGYRMYPSDKTYYYTINDFYEIVDSFSHNALNYNYFHKINDTTLVSMFGYHARKLAYINKEDFNIFKTVSYGNSFSLLIDKSKVIDNTIFFGDLEKYLLNPVFMTHTIFKHKLYSDTIETILIDTLPSEDALRSFNGLDLIDTNYIYSGSNLDPCFFNQFNYNCLSSFKLYCTSSEGQVHWTKVIGGDANNYLWHIIATPDTGCLALFYRYAEQDSALNGDFYWLKYDKFGNQDTAFLSGFNEYTNINNPPIEFVEIIVYPNPVKDFLYFDYSSNVKKPSIAIFDLNGALIYKEKIMGKKVNIQPLSNGCYFYKIEENGKELKTGKLIKK